MNLLRRLVYHVVTKKIRIAKWQFNLTIFLAIAIGLISGSYLTLSKVIIPNIFATAEFSITKQSSAEFNQGSFSSTEVSGTGNDAVVQLEGGGGADWYSGEWQYRKKITIQKEQVDDDFTDFPVLVSLSSDADLAAEAQNDFDDILFADTSKNKLAHEIEEYDADSGQLLAWVEVSSLSASADTEIYLYYGNNSCLNQENASGVWNNNYKMVQHMKDITSSSIEDSTENNNDGTKKNTNEPNQVSGKIGYGQDFGGDDHIDLPNDLGYTNEFSVFAWYKAEGSPPGNYHIIFGGQELEMSIPQSSGELRAGLRTNTRYVSNHGSGLLDGEWHLIGYTYDGSIKRGYIDGNYVGQQNVNGTLTADFAYRKMGRYGSSSTYYANGVMDEARIAATTFSGEWISTQFNNQNSPSSFYELGTEESALASSGTWVSPTDSNSIDLVWNGGWGDGNDGSTAFSATVANVGANSSIQFEMRVSETLSGLSSAEYKNLGTINSGISFSKTKSELDSLGLSTGNNRYIQVKTTLNSTDGTTNPQLDQFTIYYLSDNSPPSSNPTDTIAYASLGGIEINPDTWYKHANPHFEWTGAVDTESGVDGYYVYWGTSASGEPETEGDYQTASTYTATITESGTYYLRIKTKDKAGNTIGEIYDAFTYKYDGTNPTNPPGLSAPQSYQSDIENITIYWTSGSAVDNHSEIAGFQYKIGSEGAWYGSSHSGTEDETDLLTSSSYTLDTEFDSLTEGENTFYFRTWDNAGNTSSSNLTAILKYSGTAPTEPQNLAVDPGTSTANEFAFSWGAPETYRGQESGLEYCYTVNAEPAEDLSNCAWTSETSLSAGAYATQPSTNTFYVVARDESSNINHQSYSDINFTCNTSAPGIPRSMDIADISIKATSNWKLAVSWEEPEDIGAGVKDYKVYRSITSGADCSTSMSEFTEIGTTAGTSYTDTGLSQTTYYYCVKACDSANNCSAVSTTVNGYPDGKYTTAAELLSGPSESSITTKKAIISWTTDRTCDSRIQYGTSSNDYFDEEVSNSTHVTDHSLTLTNLSAGQTYYYKAKWTDEDGNTGTSEEQSFTTDPAPNLSGVEATDISLSTAYINFTLSNATQVTIQYGETTSYGGSVTQSVSSAENSHSIRLSGLADGTNYHYRFVMEDTEGEEYYSDDYTDLVTLPRPKVTNVRLQEIPGTAQPVLLVSWQSNTEVSSIITYYPVGQPDQAQDEVNVKLVSGRHRMLLKGLLPETDYVLVVKGRDKIGNEATSSTHNFTTATDTRPPLISNLKVKGNIEGAGEEAKAQLVVSWNTDEEGTSQVEFGEGSGSTYSQKTQKDASLTYNHLVVISNLSAQKVYHLRAISQDEAGNETKSIDTVTITPKATDNALDLVITNLSEAFKFLKR